MVVAVVVFEILYHCVATVLNGPPCINKVYLTLPYHNLYTLQKFSPKLSYPMISRNRFPFSSVVCTVS